MRLIYADEAIKAVNEVLAQYIPYLNRITAGIPLEVAAVITRVPTAQLEQRWIPCSERLPEQYGNYLISIDRKDTDIGTINPNDPRGWSLCDANGFYWANDKALNITAWQTLPEPYREDKE